MGEGARPIAPTPTASPPAPSTLLPVRGASNVVFVNGQTYNRRGYKVCGVPNQRGHFCGRIGNCPFHSKHKDKGGNAVEDEDKGSSISGEGNIEQGCKSVALVQNSEQDVRKSEDIAEENDQAESAANTEGVTKEVGTKKKKKRAANVTSAEGGNGSRLLAASGVTPPPKSRFKVSWTEEEHRKFLAALRVHGKGKWKQIAMDVKTRNANQCQSHAQKYFLRQSMLPEKRKKRSIHDITDEVMDPEARSRAAARQAGLVRNTGDEDDNTALDPMSAVVASSKPSGTSGMTTVPIMMPLGSMGGMAGGLNLAQYSTFMAGGPFAPVGTQGAVNPSPQKMRVTIHMNGESKNGKAMIIPKTLESFFDLATQKLGAQQRLTRVFTRTGGEISSLDEMCHDDMLWLSDGGDYHYPSTF